MKLSLGMNDQRGCSAVDPTSLGAVERIVYARHDAAFPWRHSRDHTAAANSRNCRVAGSEIQIKGLWRPATAAGAARLLIPGTIRKINLSIELLGRAHSNIAANGQHTHADRVRSS